MVQTTWCVVATKQVDIMITSAVGRLVHYQRRGRAARTMWVHLIGQPHQPLPIPRTHQHHWSVPGAQLQRTFLVSQFQSHLSHIADRLVLHAVLVLLTILVCLGENVQSWSQQAHSPRDRQRAVLLQMSAANQVIPAGEMVTQIVPFNVVMPTIRAPLPRPAMQPVAPAQRIPVADTTPVFQTIHRLEPDETLGEIATRYAVTLETLIWSNNLQNGDALMYHQELRIPRLSGLPHSVAPGETLDEIAARYNVTAELIAAFAPNSITLDRPLPVGKELFIPGGTAPLPEALLATRGGYTGLTVSKAQPVGIVRDAQTNMRAGPDEVYERVARFESGRRAGLLARHDTWLKVDIGGVVGWMRADLLEMGAETFATLPETDDFPAPPPIWVWPTQGAITSLFGPRWGGFHNGLDIANGAWTPIVAARTGRVLEAGWCSGYGYCVKMSHDGGIGTVYGHLIDQPVVSAGDTVKVGTVIGYMGSTYDRSGGGYSTGVHLHFTITVNGRAVNPLTFLP